jgi:hypothetical protein
VTSIFELKMMMETPIAIPTSRRLLRVKFSKLPSAIKRSATDA